MYRFTGLASGVIAAALTIAAPAQADDHTFMPAGWAGFILAVHAYAPRISATTSGRISHWRPTFVAGKRPSAIQRRTVYSVTCESTDTCRTVTDGFRRVWAGGFGR